MLYVNPYAGNPQLVHGAPDAAKREQIALQEFEQVFLKELMKSMRQMVPDGGLFPRSPEKALFEDMLDDHLARSMAESNQLGVAKQIAAQIEASRSRINAADSSLAKEQGFRMPAAYIERIAS
jgi:Rod binding domain-containing protein